MPFTDVIKHVGVDHVKLKVCGDQSCTSSDSHLIQRENLIDIAFTVHDSLCFILEQICTILSYKISLDLSKLCSQHFSCLFILIISASSVH